MTFLKILQRVCQRVGYAVPVDIANLGTGQQPLWDYIADVYEDIQNECAAWNFLTYYVTLNIQSGKRTYTTVELGQPNCRDILDKAYLLDTNDTLIQKLNKVDHDSIEQWNIANPTTARPYAYSFQKGILSFAVTPDAAYKMLCKIYRAPYKISDMNDMPVFDEELHMIIYHGVLMKYSVDDNDPELFQISSIEYEKFKNRMFLAHAPGISM